MLIPETGASTLMYVATSAPAKSPVRRSSRRAFELINTTDMRMKEMTSSATKAAAAPDAPGTVAT